MNSVEQGCDGSACTAFFAPNSVLSATLNAELGVGASQTFTFTASEIVADGAAGKQLLEVSSGTSMPPTVNLALSWEVPNAGSPVFSGVDFTPAGRMLGSFGGT
jgi:hypothetical protein